MFFVGECFFFRILEAKMLGVLWYGIMVWFLHIYISLFQNLMIRFAPAMHLISSLFYSGIQQVLRSVFFPLHGMIGAYIY